jgi:hypothetical protein
LKTGFSFIISRELANLRLKLNELKSSSSAAEMEFYDILETYLEFANFSTRPSTGDEWGAFFVVYFSKLLDDVTAHFKITFYDTERKHLRKKAIKEEKLKKSKEKKDEPLVLTETLLEKKLNALFISRSKLSNVSPSTPKNIQPRKNHLATNSKHKQGKGQHPLKTRVDARGRKRVVGQVTSERAASRRRRN